MNIITAQELKAKIENNDSFQLIDVREDYEYQDSNIGGINISLENVLNSLDKIEKDKQIIFCCRTGKRSAAIIHTLERKLQMKNLFSLQGGLQSYFEIA